jgi:hypothetical protein
MRCSFKGLNQTINYFVKIKENYSANQNTYMRSKYKSTYHIWIIKAIMKKTDSISKIKRFTYIVKAFSK